ncbi:DUF1828 domain-containing protein [Comamonas aquatica]|nr:DUF1828 domain-containing protein [Comamonas aquatica]
MSTAEAIRKSLCATFCREVAVTERAGAAAVSLPIMGRDGDFLTAYVEPATAGWRVSDKGSTLMRLSYENDLSKLLSGARERLYNTVLLESGLQEDDGELFTEVPADALAMGLFSLAQGVTRVEDLGLWTRTRVESTFADDLRSTLFDIVGRDRVTEGYFVPNVPAAESYPVDFFVQTDGVPLFVFGVQNRDKARLTTIILQHLASHTQLFNSMVVYSDVDDIPKADRNRLMNAANDSVASISDVDVIRMKIQHRMKA